MATPDETPDRDFREVEPRLRAWEARLPPHGRPRARARRRSAARWGEGTMASEARVWTIPEVAARLGLARNTAYRLAAAGRLPVPVIRVGGTTGPDGRVTGGRLMVSKAALAK